MNPSRRRTKPYPKIFATTCGVFFGISILFLAADAQAFQIKRIVRGSIDFAAADQFCEMDVTVSGDQAAGGTIPCALAIVETPASSALDLTKTILLVNVTPTQNVPDTERIVAYFGDNQTIYFTRYSSGTGASAPQVSFEAIEFDTGATVIRGVSTFGIKPNINKVIDFSPSINVTRSFVFVQTKPVKAGLVDADDSTFTVTGEFTSVTNNVSSQLTLDRDDPSSGNGQAEDVYYQILELDRDISVQTGQTLIAAGSTAAVTQAITSVGADTSKSFIHFTVRSNGAAGDSAAYAVEAKFNSTIQIQFQRDVAAASKAALAIRWFVGTFTNETYLQSQTTASTLIWNNASTPVFNDTDPLRSLVFYSARNSTTGGASDGARFTAVLNGSDPAASTDTTTPTLTFARKGTGTFSLTAFTPEFPPVDVIAPNGAETWAIGSSQTIQWRRANDVDGATMTIYLALDGDQASPTYDKVIASGVNVGGLSCAANGLCSYTWNPIPELLNTTVNIIGNKIKIKLDTNYSNTARDFDVSNAVFTLLGTLDLVTPNGSEVWTIGDINRSITWTVNGDIGNIKILFDTNGASSTFPNTTDLYPTGNLLATVNADTATSWAWNPIPDAATSQGRIKLLQVTAVGGTPILSDVSAANFTIKPSITVVKPTDTESFVVGRTHTIEWNLTGTVTSFNLYYNPGGAGYSALPGVTNPVTPTTCGANKCYSWALPTSTVQNTNVKMKVEWPSDTSVNDTGPDLGDGFFEIKPGVTLDAPTTATIIRAFQNTNVTWSHPGGLGALRVKYTTNWSGCSAETPQLLDTACWITMTTPTSATNLSAGVSGGTYVWQPPDIIGTNVGIRVMEEANPTLIYDQKGAYTLKGKITMLNPTAGSYIRVGSQYNITWDAFGTIGNVKILLSKDGGSTYPVTILGANMYKKVGAGPCNALTVDASAEIFAWGSTEHYSDSGCTTGIGAVPDERSTNAVIKVYKDATGEDDLTSGTAGATSAFKLEGDIQNLRIVEASPYGIGNTVEIRWDPKPSNVNWGTVNLKYSVTGSGGPWIAIDGAATNDVAEPPGTYANYSWTIPNNAEFPSTTVLLKAQLASDSGTYDESAQFATKGSVILSGDADTGSATPWKIGEQKTISFTKTGAGITNVAIKYSLDGGVDNYPYTIATVTGTSYTWCVGYGSDSLQNYQDCGTPTEPAGTDAHHPNKVIGSDRNANIKIKIEVVADPTMTDSTTGTLIIQKQFLNVAVPAPTLEVSDPADSATFKNITWTTKGKLPGNVLLRYDTGALTYPNNVNSGGAALSDAAGYLWQVPDAIGYNTIRVRVKADVPNDTFITGDSAAFTIKGKILATAPTGTSTLLVGVPYGITYKKLGTLGNLEIIYNHSNNLTTITPGPVPGPEGTAEATTFSWTPIATDSGALNVIDVGGTKNSKFKLTGLTHKGNANLEATVETPLFQVRGSVYDGATDRLIAEPAGGEVYAIGGANQFIKWQARGNVGNLRIRLDTNGGNGADGIANNADDYATLVRRPDAKCGTPPCYAESVPYTLDEDGAGAPYGMEWIIPDSATTQGRILIESLDNPYVRTDPTAAMSTYGKSGANFRIRINVTVTSPNAPPTPHFKVNDSMSINWTQTGTGNVNIVLDYDNDGPPYANSFTIVTNNSTKPYPWTIGSSYVAESAKITISATGDSTVADSTDTAFKIKPVLQLTAPNNSTYQWVVGTSYNVTWNLPVGDAANLKINFSTNGGKGADGNIATTADNWPDTDCVANLALCQTNKGGLITASVAAAAGTKSWTIPDIMTNEGVVRLSKVGDSESYDDSDAYFYIKGSITNAQVKNAVADAAPGTPIDLPIDNDKYITWDYTGSLGTVNIYYSTDANAGTPTWTLIPDPDGVGPRTSGANVPVDDGTAGNFGSYQWKIPNAPSPNVKVKVVNVSNPNWQDVSQFNPNGQTGAGTYNSIIGSITEVSVIADGNPSTTDMEVTGSKTIQWKPNGAMTTFKVEYRKAAGTWVEITPAGGCTGACLTVSGDYRRWTWPNIPDQISNDIDFQVSDYNDPVKVKCQSYDAACNPSPVAAYILKGKLSIVSPISTDIWTIGNTPATSIRWNKQGTIGDLKIEYSVVGTFNASDYTNGYVFTIESAYASGVNGNNDYAWPAGVIGANRKISDVGKLKITNVLPPAGTELAAISDAFKIRISITGVSSPGLDNIWYVADTDKVITWACNSGTKFDGSTPTVVLEYSTDQSAYLPVTGGGTRPCNTGTNNYTWPSVADEKDSSSTIRVSANDYSTTVNLSSASFKIHPRITVTPTPNATTKLKVGSTFTNGIKWTYTGTKTTTVDIRYDTNGGVGGYPLAQQIAAAQAIASGSTGVTWGPIPDLGINANMKVKVFDPALTEVAGESPAFKVHPGITVTDPLGGVNRTANTTMTISWTYTSTAANVGNVNVYYDLNSGLGADGIDGNADDMTLIGTQLSTNCAGGTCSYTWNGVTPQPAIPDNVLNTARIQIKSASDADIIDEATDFKLGALVSNIQPSNGQVIEVGANPTITWTKDKGLSSATQLKIEYNNAVSGTPNWQTIVASTDNDGSHIWTNVPGATGDLQNDNRIRITQVTPNNTSAVFDGAGVFGIRAAITVTEPIGGGTESWGLTEIKNIKFKKKGALGTVDIYYAADGSTYGALPINATPIDISALADDIVTTYAWTIPTSTTLSTGYSAKVKVKAVTPTAQATLLSQGISAGGFQVRGSITAVSPSGATDLVVGGSKLIQWTPVGNIVKFKIEYKYDTSAWSEISPAGGCVATTCFSTSGSDKTWTWGPSASPLTIPDTISNNVLFRVSDYDNSVTTFTSPSANTIKGSLVSNLPSGVPAYFSIGDPVTIEWTKKGSIGNLTIDYSSTGTFVPVTDDPYIGTIHSAYSSGATPTGTFQYTAWSAPSKVSETFKVRLRNNTPPAGTELTALSATFAVRPKFTTWTAPILDEIWYAADANKDIKWNSLSATKNNGTKPKVIVEYSVDDGPYTGNTIVDNLDNENGLNTYTWPSIPLNIKSNNVNIKVSFKDYPEINIVSPQFKIHPRITVTPDPNASTKLKVGSTYANLIKWTYTGSTIGINDIEIRYDTNGASSTFPLANLIATNVAVASGATGQTWTNVPNIVGLNTRVRVFDKTFPDAYGDSPSFKVMGSFALTAPIGGVNQSANSNVNITWNYTGTITSMKVYYDENSGKGADNIAGNADDYRTNTPIHTFDHSTCTGGTCSWNWPYNHPAFNVPDTVINTARLKITNAADEADVNSEGTDFKFGILISNLQPSNGQVVDVGTSPNITWTKDKGLSSTTQVKIEYNNAVSGTPNWQTIAATTDNDGTHPWPTVPGVLADLQNDNRIRISQLTPSNTSAVFDGVGVFGIRATITVTEPLGNGTESWLVGTSQNIKFQKKGALQEVNIFYAADGTNYGASPLNALPINVSALADDTVTTWVWSIPTNATLTAGYVGRIKVKAVTPAAQATLLSQGLSAASTGFQVKGSISSIAPSGATDLVVGSSKAISWTNTGSIAKFRILYRYNAGAWTEISPAGGVVSSPWTWGPSAAPLTIPDAISNDVDFRVEDYDNSNVNAESAANNLIKGSLVLNKPSGTPAVFSIGDAMDIEWNKMGTIGNLILDYSTTGTFVPVTDDPYIVSIETSYASGANGNNTYPWTAPQKVTETFRVRARNITTVTGTELTALSAQVAIRPKLNSYSLPVANEQWYVSDANKLIRWTATSGLKNNGTKPKVIIEYSVDDGPYIGNTIVDNLDLENGTNTYTWTTVTADIKSNNVKVRVSLKDYPSINIVSPAFKIHPKITVTPTPDANTVLIVTNTYNNLIKWTYTGTATTTVDIRYDTNGGAGGYPVTQVIAAAVPIANGAVGVNWANVPDAISNNVKVKVFDPAFTDALGESPAFKIRGELTLTNPTNGITWVASTDQNITWTFKGTINNVNVYYDLDSATPNDWVFLATKSQTGCTGSCSYTWSAAGVPPFPATVTNKFQIKITNAADETNVLSTGTDSKIGAQFDITAPENGAPVYAEDTATNITWSTLKGSGITKIHLYYSNSDLSTSAADPTTLGWIRITPAAGVANTSPYNWNPIPRTLTVLSTTAHRVMVTQYDPPNEAQVYSIGSGTTFPILGVLTMTTPAGGESWGVNTTQTIKFKKQGDLQTAELYYSFDGTALNYVKIKRADLTTIVDISDATGVPDAQGNYSFAWFLDPATTTLTSGFTGKIKAKVASPSTQISVESVPSNTIEVKGTVTLKAPGGTDDPTPVPMVVGNTYTITWSKFGAVNNVQLHFSTNGGIAGLGSYLDSNLIFDGASTPSSFTWTIPDKVGNNLRVRVRHKENTGVWDESDVTFRIKGALQLTAPENPGLSYTVGTTQSITWTATGTFSPVELHYDRDGNYATTADTFPVLPLSTVVNCSPVSPAITCSGSASFTIEDKITANAKVRIRGTGVDADVSWISTNPFKIVGALDVTAPEAGQIWYVGETNRSITWDATGTITNVNIGYKTSAGAACNYTAIKLNDPAHVAGANTFAWTGGVADEKSETMYICLQDVNFTEVTNVSAAPFSIRPLITVTSPTAGQRVVVASNNAGLVKWTRTGTKTTQVDIKYDTNDGKGADNIAGNADDYAGTIATLVDASTGAIGVAWNNVPDSISNLVRVKVVDSSAPLVFGVSPATFKIVGSLTFSTPTTGTYLNVGQNNLIQWTKTGSFSNVNIWYATNGTTFNNEITPSTSTALLQYNWTNIPATPSNNVVIRVADALDPDTNALSGVVHIHRIYDITQPENGEVLAVGSSSDIKWTVTGGITNTVKLQYATNGGGTSGNWTDIPGAETLANASPGTFSWNLPNAITNTAKVRVIDNSDTDNWNESGTQNNPALGTFKIRPGLTMVYPNGNASASLTEKLLVGTTVPIQWSLTGTMATVKLQVSVNGAAYTDISTPTLATGINAAAGQTGCTPSPCWNWQIPNTISQQVKVRVVNEADTTVLDPSDYDFAIKGGFTWLNPNTAGQVFKSGTTPALSWTTTGSMANVNLEYSTNNGASYAAMLDTGGLPATNILNSSPFNWPVPTNAVSKDVFLRITGTNDPNSATLTPKIKMAGVLAINAPVGGIRWGANTTQQIKWTTTGPIANIKIEHSLNGGTSWVAPAISDSTLGTGQAGCVPAPCFNWLVPTTTSANVVIRLSDVITDSGTDAVTSSVFKIVGSFGFTAPISTTVWPVTSGEIANTTQNIVWSTIGGVANVNIRYSATGAAPWTFVTGPIVDGGLGGSYAWTVPDAIGTTVKVLIEDAADPYPNTYTESSAFTIRGDLKVSAPVGGEKWGVAGGVAAAYKTISWQKNGSIAQFYLDYSKSGAAGPWISILNATSGLEHSGSNFAWNVPDDMTTNAFVRIRNVSGPAVENISPASFKIMARFDLTAPDGGEVALAGQNYNTPNGITWGKWGTNATNVKIELATGVNAAQPCSAVLATAFDKVIELNTLNDQNQPWLVSVNHVTPAACLRIYDVNDIDSENRSTSPFVIRAGFTFIDPVATTPDLNGDTIPDLEVGQAFKIIWQKTGNITNVKLEYSPGGNNFTTDIRPIEPTADGIVPNNNAAGCNADEGCYLWTVPDIEDNKDTNIKLRLRDPNDSGAETTSVNFYILPKFTVTFPVGNINATLTDKLKVGHRTGATDTPYTITWTSTSSPARTPSVTLRYSTDGGVNYTNVIGTATTSTACTTISTYNHSCSFVWASVNGGVPDTISTQARVRVEDTSDGIAKDASDYNLKIISNYRLNAPNTVIPCNGGTTVCEVGDPLTITWENIGTVANVELAYSTGGAAFTSPVVILASTPNADGTEAWPSGVADGISSTVRVRVRSLTDDGFDISDTDFRIRGKLVTTAPAAAARLAIGQPYTITWTSYGTIPNVNIKYDINDGKGTDGIAGNADDYPYTIATSAAGCTPVSPALTCNGSYNWPSVPDTAAALARVRVIDSRASESDVIGTTPAFNIVGNFALLAPNGNEDWRVNTSQTIRFNWGGTMPNVEFHYTKNTAADVTTIPAIDWISIGSQNYGAGDGSGGPPLPERTFNWTIPNDISPNVRVRVRFAGDTSVYDVSNNFFKIRGSFAITSPNGNSDVNLTNRWVTFDQKQIQWTTTGTMPNVKLQYSSDNFVADINTINLNAANCAPGGTPPYQCTGTFDWTIPDRVLKNGANFTVATDLTATYPGANMIKIRITDVNDSGVYDDSDFNFKLDYYKMTWDVRDLITNAALSGLTAKAVKDTDPNYSIWNQAGITTNPPMIKYFPYGTWVVTWSKTEYTDMAVTVTASQDRDYSVSPLGPLFMQTATVHIWTAEAGVSYDPATDKLSIVGYLMRDGSLVPGPVQAFFKILDTGVVIKTLGSASAVDPKNAKISPSWGTGVVPTYQSNVHEPASPDAQGYFLFTLNAPTGLLSGKAYVGQTDILIGTGGLFKTPKPFSVSVEKALQDLKTTVNTQLDKPLSQVESAITSAVTTILNQKMGTDPAGQTLMQKMDAQTASVTATLTAMNSAISSLELGAQKSLDAGVQLEKTAKKFSWKGGVSPNPAISGDKVTLQAQGPAGLKPTASIYNHESKQIVASAPMVEDTVRPGNYSVEFTVSAGSFPAGKAYTFIVTEDTSGGLAAGSGFVESISLTTLAGLAAAAPGAERAAKEAVSAIRSLEIQMSKGGELGGVKESMNQLKAAVNQLTEVNLKEFAKGGTIGDVRDTVKQIAQRLNRLAGNEGYDFKAIVQESLDSSQTVKDIRRKVDDVNTTATVMGAVIERKFGGIEDPVVVAAYTSGSVKLRVVAVNPSETKTQFVPIKIYLPQETAPKNIIEQGELELGYDSDKSLYFVYKDKVVLAPKETRVFEVELEDIWFVPQPMLDDLRGRTEHIIERLEGTGYLDQAKLIAETIYGRLRYISTVQADESISKELHIGLYRTNMKELERIKEDIARLEKLLVAVGAPPAPEMLAENELNLKSPSRATTWVIIFGIVIFIGLLTAVFFFTWQAQARISTNLASKTQEEIFPELQAFRASKDSSSTKVSSQEEAFRPPEQKAG